MDVLLDLLKYYGIPLTMLVALAVHHVRTLRSHKTDIGNKDDEIKRLNEERLKEKGAETDRLLGMVTEFNKLQGEQTTSLNLIADRLPARR